MKLCILQLASYRDGKESWLIFQLREFRDNCTHAELFFFPGIILFHKETDNMKSKALKKSIAND